MAYHSFEELAVWQRACRLSVEIFEVYSDCRYLNLKSQIERAGLSIPSNIAEGAERGGAREFGQFLKIAKGSCAEVRTQLYISRKLDCASQHVLTRLIQESKEISAMLEGLRKSLSKPAPTKST
jgi:four helix bundle protein